MGEKGCASRRGTLLEKSHASPQLAAPDPSTPGLRTSLCPQIYRIFHLNCRKCMGAGEPHDISWCTMNCENIHSHAPLLWRNTLPSYAGTRLRSHGRIPHRKTNLPNGPASKRDFGYGTGDTKTSTNEAVPTKIVPGADFNALCCSSTGSTKNYMRFRYV